MKYLEFSFQPTFFLYLSKIDKEIADKAQQLACPSCGGKLHVANFSRSGHGMPQTVDIVCKKRFSFCCQDCRKRLTPDSVRFLRGISYVTITLVFFCAIHQGLTDERAKVMTDILNVPRQTVARWIEWWRKYFVTSPFWRQAKARFMPPLNEQSLALELINNFAKNASPSSAQVINLLRFLAPLGKKLLF